MDAPEQMQRLIIGHRMTQAVHVAAVLGLSDLLAGDPVGVADLAAATDVRSAFPAPSVAGAGQHRRLPRAARRPVHLHAAG